MAGKRISILVLAISIFISTPASAAVIRQPFDELRIEGQSKSPGKTDSTVYSMDELNINFKKAEPNDGYKSGYFDELHINAEAAKERANQNPAIIPEPEGFRIPNFDELHYVSDF